MQIRSYMLNAYVWLYFTIGLDVDSCFPVWPVDSVLWLAVGKEDTGSLIIVWLSLALLPLAWRVEEMLRCHGKAGAPYTSC